MYYIIIKLHFIPVCSLPIKLEIGFPTLNFCIINSSIQTKHVLYLKVESKFFQINTLGNEINSLITIFSMSGSRQYSQQDTPDVKQEHHQICWICQMANAADFSHLTVEYTVVVHGLIVNHVHIESSLSILNMSMVKTHQIKYVVVTDLFLCSHKYKWLLQPNSLN